MVGGWEYEWAVNLLYMLLSTDMPAEQGNNIYTASLEAACFEWVLQAAARESLLNIEKQGLKQWGTSQAQFLKMKYSFHLMPFSPQLKAFPSLAPQRAEDRCFHRTIWL